jgi:hypothetical protein
LLQAIAAQEAGIVRLQGELAAFNEPLDEKLAVMPSWVRQQLEDTAALLTDTPERTKTVFRQMGVSFTLHPVREQGQRPFLRPVGASDIAHVISGQFSVSTSGAFHPESSASRTTRLVIALPPNSLSGRYGRRTG